MNKSIKFSFPQLRTLYHLYKKYDDGILPVAKGPWSKGSTFHALRKKGYIIKVGESEYARLYMLTPEAKIAYDKQIKEYI